MKITLKKLMVFVGYIGIAIGVVGIILGVLKILGVF